jgi:hypothetical protein
MEAAHRRASACGLHATDSLATFDYYCSFLIFMDQIASVKLRSVALRLHRNRVAYRHKAALIAVDHVDAK